MRLISSLFCFYLGFVQMRLAEVEFKSNSVSVKGEVDSSMVESEWIEEAHWSQ